MSLRAGDFAIAGLRYLHDHFGAAFKNISLDFAASLRIEETISRAVLFFHSLVIWALILCRSCMNFGSFTANLAHLFRRTNVYLYKAMFFVHGIYANTRFMSYNMLEVPAYHNRDLMHCGNSYMQGIRQVFVRYNISFNIHLSKVFAFLGSKNLFESASFNGVKKFLAGRWIRCPFDLGNDKVRSIHAVVVLTRYCKKVYRCFSHPGCIFRIKSIYDRCVYVDAHKFALPTSIGLSIVDFSNVSTRSVILIPSWKDILRARESQQEKLGRRKAEYRIQETVLGTPYGEYRRQNPESRIQKAA